MTVFLYFSSILLCVTKTHFFSYKLISLIVSYGPLCLGIDLAAAAGPSRCVAGIPVLLSVYGEQHTELLHIFNDNARQLLLAQGFAVASVNSLLDTH